jgi:hypothetical protein
MEFKGTKEKAKELRDKYLNVRWDIGTGYAKQCALIAVDEIIEELKFLKDTEDCNEDVFDGYHYWQEVKNEIEKL